MNEEFSLGTLWYMRYTQRIKKIDWRQLQSKFMPKGQMKHKGELPIDSLSKLINGGRQQKTSPDMGQWSRGESQAVRATWQNGQSPWTRSGINVDRFFWDFVLCLLHNFKSLGRNESYGKTHSQKWFSSTAKAVLGIHSKCCQITHTEITA